METLFPINPEKIYLPRINKPPKIKPKNTVRIVHGAEAREALNAALLPLYTPKFIYDDVGEPSNIYYRVYKMNGEYAVFLLYEWPYQTVPPHKYDYEPVIVFLDKNMNIKEVYVDGFHYYIQKYRAPPFSNKTPHIRITAPCRSMEVRWSGPKSSDVMVYPLNEAEGRSSKTKIQYLSDKKLSELEKRDVNPLTIHEKLVRNPWSVRQAKHWATYDNPTVDDLLKDIAKNYGLKKYEYLLYKAKLVLASILDKIVAFFQSIIGSEPINTKHEERLNEQQAKPIREKLQPA